MKVNDNKDIFKLSQLIASPLIKWTALVLFGCALYFGNTYVQSKLGRQAMVNTGLRIHSLEAALVKARDNDKLVLANMSAIWCPSCRKLDREVFSNEQVKNLITKDFVFARIDYDAKEGRDFMGTYKIFGFPTLLILNGEGDKLHHLPLTFDPQKFADLLNKARALEGNRRGLLL
ncbi:MAG: thiol:disulfide interchange protein [Paraglaciecola sp.]|jgi:thiol:disulfide interchange protein